jgi:hypothetical protein
VTKAAFAAVLVALVVCPAAAAHGGGGARGFVSTVTSLRPAAPGLEVTVLESDDRLLLRNESGQDVLIKGYDGEPYLRFTRDGAVFRNANSPATYLNEERYGGVAVPASAGKTASPRWERVGSQHSHEWHDHRIHWMSTIDPRMVRDAPEERHHVFNWTVRGELGGRPLTILGRLDYAPPPDSRFKPVLIIPIVALTLAGAAVWWLRRPRARR